MIFSHTHQPLNGALDEACGDVRFWNTALDLRAEDRSQDPGSEYLDLGLPGTAVLIDTERGDPQLAGAPSRREPARTLSNGSVPRPLGHSYEDAVGSRAVAA